MNSLKMFVLWLLAFFALGGVVGYGQNVFDSDFAEQPKNLVKLNILGLTVGSFSAQYERAFTPHVSLALGVRVQPKRGLVFRSAVENWADATDSLDKAILNTTRFSSWAITPEFRCYFGRRPSNGFYVAPFVRIEGYKLSWAYDFREASGQITNVRADGKVNTFSGGLMLGAQWHLGANILLDWWIGGPAIGTMNLDLTGSGNIDRLSPDDKRRLVTQIENIELPGGTHPNADIRNNTVEVIGKINYTSFRTGLCIGYTF